MGDTLLLNLLVALALLGATQGRVAHVDPTYYLQHNTYIPHSAGQHDARISSVPANQFTAHRLGAHGYTANTGHGAAQAASQVYSAQPSPVPQQAFNPVSQVTQQSQHHQVQPVVSSYTNSQHNSGIQAAAAGTVDHIRSRAGGVPGGHDSTTAQHKAPTPQTHITHQGAPVYPTNHYAGANHYAAASYSAPITQTVPAGHHTIVGHSVPINHQAHVDHLAQNHHPAANHVPQHQAQVTPSQHTPKNLPAAPTQTVGNSQPSHTPLAPTTHHVAQEPLQHSERATNNQPSSHVPVHQPVTRTPATGSAPAPQHAPTKHHSPVNNQQTSRNQPAASTKSTSIQPTAVRVNTAQQAQGNKRVQSLPKTRPSPSAYVYWSNWYRWTDCSATCGEGYQTRSRHCFTPSGHFTMDQRMLCAKQRSESRKCTLTCCPVDGSWSYWSKWSSYEGSHKYIQKRKRTCSKPYPTCGGQFCSGITSETRYFGNFLMLLGIPNP